MAQTATVQIQMPEMGESVTEGIVLEWHVVEGDFVSEGDTVVEVSTDKVDAEVPAPADGVITKLIAQVDDEVPVGAPLAEMEPGEGTAEGSGASGAGPVGAGGPPPPAGAEASSGVGPPAPPPARGGQETAGTRAGDGTAGGNGAGNGVRVTPVARRVGEETGVDLDSVSGNGPGGKVTKDDVLAAADGGNGAPAQVAGEAKPLRGPAAMLAQAMGESREVPTATSFRTVAVDTLDAKRKALNGQLKERGLKVSFTHLIAWAIVQAAKQWPVMTLTSTYDHRVIQGAESGAFLRRIEQLLEGGDGFYETVAADLDIDAAPLAAAHPASASAPPLGAAAPPAAPGAPDEELLGAVQAATSLLKGYRTHGHLAARLDPLGREPKGDPAIQPENLNLTPELMARAPASILRIGVPGETLLDVLPRMREAYCGTIAYQFEHLSSHQQRTWVREMVETGAHRQPRTGDEKRRLLGRLIDGFEFERFVEKAYLGQKIFTIEGLDAIVPMLDELVPLAGRAGAGEVVFGMAHRGRLAVLAHNLGRSVESILAEFEGSKQIEQVKAVAAIPHGGTGDVKYHYGHQGVYETHEGEKIAVRLYPNPSHLEFVNPVVEGATRFIQSELDGPKLEHEPKRAVPVLLHGDAAFHGQGVVAETLNLQALRGYTTGGTVHIIQDNQVGFTTDPEDARSTPYAADMAKGFNVPIVHVNADDVEACSAAIRLAMAYRERWGRDIVIDVIGYRRFGHNETDEPAYTQPTMAAKIKSHPPVSEIYAEKLIGEGTISAEDVAKASEQRREEMSTALKQLREKMEAGDYEDPTVTGTTTSTGELLDRTASPPVDTAVPAEKLRALNQALLKTPEGFNVHRKLRRPLSKRLEAIDQGDIDFGHAEALAFGSLLTEGVHIRLTGQDTERGTFSHRHLVLHDENTGLKYAPMQNLDDASAPFELHNSPLSEIACLGFEYGYSAASPSALVLWEAQFGDFANAGQVIIDSFIVSGEAKWGQTSRLTLLLPHGYEGSGPEHSSARIERFLALGAEGNIRIAYPTTAAQYFHLLRRQALIRKPRPLIAFTPNGLLRLDRATASLEELTEGELHFILDDPKAEGRHEKVERLVLCTGKVYFDIDASERRDAAENVAIARVEILYPFAKEQLKDLIASYPNLKEIAWVQEEPRNMGAWKVMSRRMPELLPEGVELTYIGRQGRASPGEGYSGAHALEQERIVLTALTPGA